MGRTLASVYSPRPKPLAAVSVPLMWREVEQGATVDDFRIDKMTVRIAKYGRFDLERLL